MKDIIVNINKDNRMVYLPKTKIANAGENLQSRFVFKFEDEFVNGQAYLEYKRYDEETEEDIEEYIILSKEDESYICDITNVLTKPGVTWYQLSIYEGTDIDHVPLFISNNFFIELPKNINAITEAPEEYETWIQIISAKINQMDNLDIDIIQEDNNARIILTRKDGTSKEITIEGATPYDDTELRQLIEHNINDILNLQHDKVNYQDLEDIIKQINQVNELAEQNERDITNLDNKVTALEQDFQEQEQTLNHLDDIKADRTELPDVSQFVKITTDNLVNYYKKSETYTRDEVNQLVGTIKGISMKIVPEKPQIGETNIIYLVPSKKTTTENIYDEYIYVNGKWEIIGSTAIDLSDYYTIEQINQLLFDYVTSTDLEITLNNYVLKETGKSLSSNDYTNADKSKVDNSVSQNEFNILAEKVAEIELFKFPNAIIHGTPTINQGQVSDFSQENYLSFPAIFDLHDRGFEFNFAFRTGNDVTIAQNIIGSKFCMALFIQNAKINLRVSSNGSSWDLVDIQGNIDIQPDTTYYVQIYFDKLTYKLKYSLDGQSYTDIASKVASVSPHPAQIYLGVGNNFHNPFKGIINLNKCYLKVNNSIIWQRNG